jgi:energy-coupling factor transporter ATP-binding protein EcfA2
MVAMNGKRILLCGAPGAGKTTLALALVGSGLAYGGDDIVHFEPDGAAAGIPFPAAAKSGSWTLLDSYVDGLSGLPVHQRADGVRLHYVLPARLDTDGPRPIDAALFLERKDGAAARAVPMAPLEALCILLESAWSERHFAQAPMIAALARDLSRAKLRRLVYDDLASAVAIVKNLADE